MKSGVGPRSSTLHPDVIGRRDELGHGGPTQQLDVVGDHCTRRHLHRQRIAQPVLAKNGRVEQQCETEGVDEDQPHHHEPGSDPIALVLRVTGTTSFPRSPTSLGHRPGSRISLPPSCHVRVAATRAERPDLLRESVLGPPGWALASDRRAQPASKMTVSSNRSKWGPSVRYTTAPVNRQAALELAHNHPSGWSCPGFTDPGRLGPGSHINDARCYAWPCGSHASAPPPENRVLGPQQPPPHLKDSS